VKIGFFALSIEFLYGKENFMLKRVINAIDCFYFLSIFFESKRKFVRI